MLPTGRLDDGARHLAGVLLQRHAHRVEIVERHGEGVAGEVGRHAGAVRHPEGHGAGTGLHQQAVGVAVVAAGELEDAVAPGKAARQADGAHRRLGAGIHQAHHVDGRERLDDQPSQVHLARRGRPEAATLGGGGLHGGHHLRMGVPQDHRTPRADVVDVGVAVHVVHPRALGALDEGRLQVDRLVRPHRAVDAAGDDLLRLLEERGGGVQTLIRHSALPFLMRDNDQSAAPAVLWPPPESSPGR